MNQLSAILPLVLMFAIFYFLIIRPQQKQAKAHKLMIENLQVGDEIISAGGFYGHVTRVESDAIYVKLGQNMEVKLRRANVSEVVKKATHVAE